MSQEDVDQPVRNPGIRYRAFISYSHKDADWGKWLHRELEKFRVSRDLVGRDTPMGAIPANLRPIFADREEFASGPSLKEATAHALSSSEFLIVVCSPRAAKSVHVNEEIRLFKASGRSSRVIAIIVDGEPNDAQAECFPPALKHRVTAEGTLSDLDDEPVAADARESADGRDLAKLKVIAGLLGIGLDEIRRRAARAARRRLAAVSAIAATMGVLAIAAGVEAWIAHERRREAEQRLDWALETARSVTAKTTNFKSRFGVPAPVIAELLQEVERLLGRLSEQGVRSAELASREAQLYGALADGHMDTGDVTKALIDAEQSLAKLTQYASEKGMSPDTRNDIAWAHLRVGDILKQENRLGDANKQFVLAKELLEALARDYPADPRWQESLAAALKRLADLLSTQGKLDAARASIDLVIKADRALLQRYPAHNPYKYNLILALNSLGDLILNSTSAEDAYTSYNEALSISSSLASSDASNVDWMGALAQSKQNVGISLERRGRSAEAIEFYRGAREIRRKISDLDPTNVQKLDKLAFVVSSTAYLLQTTGHLQEAELGFADVVSIRRKITSLDPLNNWEKGTFCIALMQLGQVRFNLGATDASMTVFEEAVSACAASMHADPSNSAIKSAQLVNLGSISIVKEARGDAKGSLAAVEEMVRLADELQANEATSVLKVSEALAAHKLLAEKLRAQKRPLDALDTLLTQRAAVARLSGTDDVILLNMFSYYYDELYLANLDLDRYSEAIEAAQNGVALCKRWSDVDQTNSLAREQLAASYTNLGIAYRFAKHLDDSHSNLLRGLDIRKDLADKDPKNIQMKSALATSWSRLNDLLWDQRNYGEALEAEQNALDLRKRIVEFDPQNINFLSDLGDSYAGVGDALARLDRTDEAKTALDAALKIRQTLVERQPQNEQFQADVERARNRLAKLKQ
ncbi:toll/interleukin-1 receptor domain-containing protein [Bradyrhizobium guangzhouense]|uniref:TIR domain-containing protein n=1 Tax=Bradyrhizobium guangzhouense TaxID=1325095 RepID=A0AAE5X6L1_9BRAD|nr:toll/interleukin-1 receptor domain-containing protein [Bradyrhizobium guangzhouense]QAU49671.1 hypothetical protein XH91_32770 [Bradyrhizobium guangzhouense]